MYDIYWELLEYIHTRYNPMRQDDPSRKQDLNEAEFEAIVVNGMRRLPSELERRFFDILYLIAQDWWLVPDEKQWIDIM